MGVRIGILGGSFNPVHRGHVFLGKFVKEKCSLDKIIMIPTGRHPFEHKRKNMPAAEDRFNMVSLAVEGEEGIEVSDIEIRSPELSYTYHTLSKLRDIYGADSRIYFITGTDEILELDLWYEAEKLLREFSFIVGIRPHYEMEKVQGKLDEYRSRYNADIQIIELPAPDISSTEVRAAVEEGRSISDMVPEGVAEYIAEHGLYAPAAKELEVPQILKLLEERLKPSRYRHTLGVRNMAVKLAELHGCDVKKAEKAALLHDFCKNLSVEESDRLVEKYGLGHKFIGNTALAHSQTAAKLLEDEYGVEDREILDAIQCHTVGKPGMTLLDKIIYVSDTIEEGRDFPGVEDLREAAYRDINDACIKVLDRTIMYVLAKGEDMDNKAIAWKTAEIMDSKKGQDIVIIDIGEKSGFADYFVITHAPSERLMKTIADEVEDKLAELGVFLKRSEGKNGSGWILMDFGDIVVNVFTQEQRARYNLEKLWGDGEVIYFESENN